MRLALRVNGVHSVTSLRFTLPERTPVSLVINDLAGWSRAFSAAGHTSGERKREETFTLKGPIRMQPERIGLIGFGEAGAVFSKALALSGTQVEVYDILLEQDDEAAGMRERILAAGCRSVSLDQVVENNEIILSTVLTHVALEVATTCTSMLKPGQVYVDLNSTSPSVKVELGTIIKPSGADFVEGAILGAIGATGAKTRILLAGEKGPETAERLTGWGLNAFFYSEKIGDASTFKMLRSIFSKGLETLILELLIAGKKAGIHKDLWEDITDFMAQEPFLKIASNWGQTHAMAYKRRYH
ncbi:MAG: NAD(P)-dependent oxidoreductase, partial [Fidelibacterota bacterium]